MTVFDELRRDILKATGGLLARRENECAVRNCQWPATETRTCGETRLRLCVAHAAAADRMGEAT